MFLSYTIFTDAALTEVRAVANLFDTKADRALESFRVISGREPREGDVICGCRIDRIGSEVQGG